MKKLIDSKTKQPIKVGDRVKSPDGQKMIVKWIHQPNPADKTKVLGRVQVTDIAGVLTASYAPGLVGAEWKGK